MKTRSSTKKKQYKKSIPRNTRKKYLEIRREKINLKRELKRLIFTSHYNNRDYCQNKLLKQN